MPTYSTSTSTRSSQPPKKPKVQPPPSSTQPPTQSSSKLYTLISSAPFQRQHLSHTLHTIHSVTTLLNSHASLLPFAQENPAEGPTAPFYAIRTRSTLLNLTRSLTQLLHDLTSQPWWPQRGQVFVQLTAQVETLRSAEQVPSSAGPNRIVWEIYDDAKFFHVLLRPLLGDLKFALERAGADLRVWGVGGGRGGGEVGRGQKGRRGKEEILSGLSAVRPGDGVSSKFGEVEVMPREKRDVKEVKVRCEECGCEMTVERKS